MTRDSLSSGYCSVVSHHPVLGCIEFIAPAAWTQRHVVLNRDAYGRNKLHNLCGVWGLKFELVRQIALSMSGFLKLC